MLWWFSMHFASTSKSHSVLRHQCSLPLSALSFLPCQAMSTVCPAQQLSHSKQAQIDVKDVATSKLRKELHTQSVEASEAAARLDSQEKSIHTTADQLSRSRQEVRPEQPACSASVAFVHPHIESQHTDAACVSDLWLAGSLAKHVRHVHMGRKGLSWRACEKPFWHCESWQMFSRNWCMSDIFCSTRYATSSRYQMLRGLLSLLEQCSSARLHVDMRHMCQAPCGASSSVQQRELGQRP